MTESCQCSRRPGGKTRDAVFQAEREYLSMLKAKGGLASYQQLVRTVKSTWGLCSFCDDKLRRMVLAEQGGTS